MDDIDCRFPDPIRGLEEITGTMIAERARAQSGVTTRQVFWQQCRSPAHLPGRCGGILSKELAGSGPPQGPQPSARSENMADSPRGGGGAAVGDGARPSLRQRGDRYAGDQHGERCCRHGQGKGGLGCRGTGVVPGGDLDQVGRAAGDRLG